MSFTFPNVSFGALNISFATPNVSFGVANESFEIAIILCLIFLRNFFIKFLISNFIY